MFSKVGLLKKSTDENRFGQIHISHKEKFTQSKLLLLVYYNIKSQYVVQENPIFNKKDTMILPAKKRNDGKQNDYKRKQLQIIFFCAGDKSLKLLTHNAHPSRHRRSL